MVLKKSEEREKEEKALITFLKRTKEGEYAKIDKSSLACARVKEQREPSYNDDEFYYSLSRDILNPKGEKTK